MLWRGLDLLFPPTCGGCRRGGYRLCPDCRTHILPVQEPVCDVCCLPQPAPGICVRCKEIQPAYYKLHAWAIFEGPMRSVLHELKYRRNLSLGDTLAQAMSREVKRLGWPIDLVLPIPLGTKRRRERGYNQVGLVAMPLAYTMGWRYEPQALKRIRETRSQVGLSVEERRENVKGVFLADPRLIKNKIILLMDDVATTGATLASASNELVRAGSGKVYALTLARALPHQHLQII